MPWWLRLLLVLVILVVALAILWRFIVVGMRRYMRRQSICTATIEIQPGYSGSVSFDPGLPESAAQRFILALGYLVRSLYWLGDGNLESEVVFGLLVMLGRPPGRGSDRVYLKELATGFADYRRVFAEMWPVRPGQEASQYLVYLLPKAESAWVHSLDADADSPFNHPLAVMLLLEQIIQSLTKAELRRFRTAAWLLLEAYNETGFGDKRHQQTVEHVVQLVLEFDEKNAPADKAASTYPPIELTTE